MKAPLRVLKTTFLTGCLLGTLFGGTLQSFSSAIPEPSTVFYGKVIGTGGAQPFILHEGRMEWTVRQSDGENVVLWTTLYRLNNGEFSYRMDIPHSILAEGAGSGLDFLLPPLPQTNQLMTVTVDEERAVIAGPAGASFLTAQKTRAATYRLDLELGRSPSDRDGDGIPDWWEDKYGLNSDDPADGGLDLDGDAVANLDEYLRGLDPTRDSRVPFLATDELLVYPDCLTGVRLNVLDTDTDSSNIVITVESAPAEAGLMLRSVDGTPDLTLSAGSAFTLEDVENGRLVWLATNSVPGTPSFSISVQDEDASHAASTGIVDVAFFTPTPDLIPANATEHRRRRAYAVGLANAAVIWDETFALSDVALRAPSSRPYSGEDLPQMMTSGRGDDRLTGGTAADILVGGVGLDVLTGGPGPDLFVFDEWDLGQDVITDFTPNDGDVINLDGLFGNDRGWVADFVQFDTDGTNTFLGVDLSGQGSGYTNLVITLADTVLTDDEAFYAVVDQRVKVGQLVLKPRVTIEAVDAEASENANNSGVFLIRREGDLSSAITVSLSIGGSADNGEDYSLLPTEVLLLSGQASVELTVSPFADSKVEQPEIVEISLFAGTGYELGAAEQAHLTILDLQAVVGIQVVEGIASSNPAIPGSILITRNGQTTEGLVVNLDISGSAANGTDYSYLSTVVVFNPGQVAIPLQISLLPGAQISGLAETVHIGLKESVDFALADQADGLVLLLAYRDNFANWMGRVFPDVSQDPVAFAVSDPDASGLTVLERYAFGMDGTTSDKARLPQLAMAGGYLEYKVYRNPGALDIRMEVEHSSDLLQWTASELLFEQVHSNEVDVHVYRSRQPASDLPVETFMRVNVFME